MPYDCANCDRSFGTEQGIKAHCNAKGHTFSECRICDRVFRDGHALGQHLTSVHEYCYDCDVAFVDSYALKQHYEISYAHRGTYCRLCDRNFRDAMAKAQHVQNSQAHWGYDEECHICDETFRDEAALNQHLRYQHPFCVECDRVFKDEQALQQHLRDSSAHKRVVVFASNTFCTICAKEFRNPGDLQRHNASTVHRARNTPCIACPSKFKTPSGLAQHIENNCSQLPLNRNQITGTIQRLNVASKMSLRSSIDGPSPSSRPMITYQATENAFNGTGYQCHICYKTFRALESLEAHLNSPAHDEDEFKCPKCDTHFKLVSGLVQHLESRACGLSSIDDVERRFNKMTASFSRSLMF